MRFKPYKRKGAYVCGSYVKYSSTYCTSHYRGKGTSTIKADLKSLIKDSVKIENLYGIAEVKAMSVQSHVLKEIKRTEKQLEKLDKQFDQMLTLHLEGAITTEQFNHQNERNALQQQELITKKAELIIVRREK